MPAKRQLYIAPDTLAKRDKLAAYFKAKHYKVEIGTAQNHIGELVVHTPSTVWGFTIHSIAALTEEEIKLKVEGV